MSGDFLAGMASASRARTEEARKRVSERALRARARDLPRPPPLRLDSRGFDILAEIKFRSPAAGALQTAGFGVGERAAAYAGAGAAAVSVLTEPARFDGSLAHLEEAVRALAPAAVPAMRKDFLVDPYQVLEARAAGAGGVLLILRMLSRQQIDDLIGEAQTQGLFVLLEAFDESDIDVMHEVLERHGAADRMQLLAGLNSRDLVTLQVVPDRLETLAERLPRNMVRVAESGVETPEDARRLADAGYQMALIGSALMRAGDPAASIAALLGAGRARA